MPSKNVVVVGTGTMGPGIAAVFALGGWRTVLLGRTPDALASGLDRSRLAGANLERLGLLSPGRAAEAETLLSGSTDMGAAAADADFVVECIAEHLEAKRDCFRHLDEAARPDTILATNTSGLSISAIAAATSRPARIAGMHWWNPPHLIPLVEVVRGEQTDEATLAAVADTARALGKTPVLVRKDAPGFIGNRLQYALLREAIHMVEAGIASAEDVDAAVRAGPGLRYAAMGPLEVADLIGLDVVADVMAYLLPELGAPSATPDSLARLVASDKLGVKRGGGFHDCAGRPLADLLTERDERLAALPGITGLE